jgi:hypothetical protein
VAVSVSMGSGGDIGIGDENCGINSSSIGTGATAGTGGSDGRQWHS